MKVFAFYYRPQPLNIGKENYPVCAGGWFLMNSNVGFFALWFPIVVDQFWRN